MGQRIELSLRSAMRAGPHLDAYAKKAFTLATGLTIDWQADTTINTLTELRRIAD
ncbi:MAG: hypothetical protein ABIV13_05905 [Fimbriimonadales bacterium]